MRISKKIENELWMMLELSGRALLSNRKRNHSENKTHVIGCQSREISCNKKYVDPKKIN